MSEPDAYKENMELRGKPLLQRLEAAEERVAIYRTKLEATEKRVVKLTEALSDLIRLCYGLGLPKGAVDAMVLTAAESLAS